MRTDKVWQSSDLTQKYLNGVRGVIPLAREQIEVMMQLVRHNGKPVTRFLDLGCGDGILTSVILERFTEAEGTLLDFSEEMLAAARKQLSHATSQLKFLRADYAYSDWVDMVADRYPFDVIVSGYSIHHQPDSRKKTLYAEIFDLLTADGIFINIEHVASATPWGELLWDHRFVDALHRMYQAQGKPKSRDEIFQVYYDSDERAANLLAPVDVQCQWLQDIGFTDVDCYFRIYELAVFSGRKPA
jgi:SAM-dependent methyltransferase